MGNKPSSNKYCIYFVSVQGKNVLKYEFSCEAILKSMVLFMEKYRYLLLLRLTTEYKIRTKFKI